MGVHDQIDNPCISLTLSSRIIWVSRKKSYENHEAAPGHHFNRDSMEFFYFVSTHHLGITKNHMKIMGQHLVIISRSGAMRDTLTLEEDPEVSEYLSEYILLCQSA
jgi:uncharacterized beta-barrel protein YwiB (DUF1934 family)